MNHASTLEANLSETTLIDTGGQMQTLAASTTIINIDGQVVSGGGYDFKTLNIRSGTSMIACGMEHCYTNVYSNSELLSCTIIGGSVSLKNGGIVKNMIFKERVGSFIVSNGGSAYNTILKDTDSPAATTVFSGGYTYNTWLSPAWRVDVYGIAEYNTISGQLNVCSGGIAKYNSVYGTLGVGSGGVASNTYIASGGLMGVAGYAYRSTVSGSGSMNVSSDGVASNSVIHGQQDVGGKSYENYVHGMQNIKSGGSAIATTVYEAGTQTISNGGLARNTTVISKIYSNFLPEEDPFAANQMIYSGGIASNTTLRRGKVIVGSSGTLKDAKLYDNGKLTVYDGGIISGTYTVYHGSLALASGAVLRNFNLVIALGGASDDFILNLSNTSLINSLNWSVNDGGSTAAGIYKITNVSLSSLNLNLSGSQRTLTAGSSFDITNSNETVTYSLASSAANGTVLSIYGVYRLLCGTADGDNWRLTTANSKVTGAIYGTAALSTTVGNVYLDINLNAENNTGNIYGVGASASAGGNIEMRLHGNGTYYGMIFGGSYLQDAGGTIGGDVNLSVSGISQLQNPAFTYGSTRWLMGGFYANANKTGVVNGNVNMTVDGNANLGNVMGGGYAIGAGATTRIKGDVNMIFRNVTIGGHVAAGGYTTNGGTSIIEGNVNILIDATESITFYGNIIAGGYNRAEGLATVNQVLGSRTVTLTGQGSNINIPYGGINGGDNTPGGTRTVVFDDFTGTFAGGLYYLDKVKFSGNTILSGLGNTFSCSNFVFDVSDRAAIHNNTSMMDNSAALNFKQNTGTIEVILDLGDFNSAKNIALMDYDANLNLDLNVKLFDLDGAQLASFADNGSWAVNDNWQFALNKSNGVISLAYQAIS